MSASAAPARPPRHAPNDYVFPLDSAIWRINSRWTGMVYGPAAAILQIAHPGIAHGVARHSDFRNDTLGRLRRTLRDTNSIAFGTWGQADETKARLRGVHAKVRGTSDSGVEYNAFDQDLMVWVLATLVFASIQGRELVYGPLGLDEKQALLDDMTRFGTFFGVQADDDRLRIWNDFARYYNDMIHGDTLGSDPACGMLARCLVKPTESLTVRALGCAMDFIPIETLPPNLLAPLTLRSTRITRLKMRAFRKVFPAAFRALPRKWQYYQRTRQRLFENR